MPHIEQLQSVLAMREKQFEGDIFDVQDPIDALDRQLLTDLLNPLLDVGPRQSSLITSGYLAAKAKMARAESLAILIPSQEAVEIVESPIQDLTDHSHPDQRPHWSRRSSPGPQATISNLQPLASTDYDDYGHLVRFSSLHAASKHDEVRHFCDDHNKHVKWRRRTMIFEKRP